MEEEPLNIDELFLPVSSRSLRRLPRLVAGSIRLCYLAARREFLTSVFLQLLAGIALAVQLPLAKRVLDAVLSTGSGGDFAGVLPELVTLAVVSALVSFANLARAEQQMASGVVGLISSLFAIAGIGTAMLFLQPVFLLVVFVAYIPVWLASAQASRVSHEFSVEQTERDRSRFYMRQVLSGKDEAKEVRAFNLGAFFRERHDHLVDLRIAELRKVIRRRLTLGLVGGLATSFLTAAAVGSGC